LAAYIVDSGTAAVRWIALPSRCGRCRAGVPYRRRELRHWAVRPHQFTPGKTSWYRSYDRASLEEFSPGAKTKESFDSLPSVDVVLGNLNAVKKLKKKLL